MKFSHRLVGLAVVVVLLIFGYFLYGDELMPDLKLRTKELVSIVNTPRKVIPDRDVCEFSETYIPKTGIHTQELFDSIPINDGLQPVRFAASKDKKKPPIHPQPLRVFLIPHSHNDPGWLKTLRRYYEDQTKSILDNMVKKLTKFPDMTFVWSETVFLSIWWKEITAETKKQVKKLIDRGQLELVTGGWVDPDEATTHYVDIIDEMMEGHRWLERHLKVKPKVYWTPDPFGYSSTMPMLVKRAGFKQMVILRIHDEVKRQLRDKKHLEFFWRQSWDRDDKDTDMFTHLLPYILYSIKHSCGPDPYVCLMFDFRKIPGEYSEANPPILTNTNLDTYARYLVDQFRAKADNFRQNVIFMPLGDDFRYDHAIEWDQQYSNYKKLFDYINKQKDWNIKATFGTPSQYFRTLESDAKYYHKSDSGMITKPKYPVLYGDFYPYMDRDEEYWTGFFTTRPFWKGLSREIQSDLRKAELLNSLACAYAKYSVKNFHALLKNLASLDTARQSIALFQHHDAVTGTSKPIVVLDYADRLWNAKQLTHQVMLTAASYLLSSGKVQMNSTRNHTKHDMNTYVLDLDDARTINSQSEDSKTTIPLNFEGTKVIFFNPIGHLRQELVTLLVDDVNIIVTDHEGNPVESQIVPRWRNRHAGSVYENSYYLVFYTDVQGFALRSYIVKKVRQKFLTKFTGQLATISTISTSEITTWKWNKKLAYDKTNDFYISNHHFNAHFDRKYGLLQSLKYAGDNLVRINVRFLSYTSSRSGAYLFYPQGKANDKQFTGAVGTSPLVTIIRGALVSDVRVEWPYLTHTVRIYHGHVPHSHSVQIHNRLDMSGDSTFFQDKEIIMRLYTSVLNDNVFYTDLNGYQIRRRKWQEKLHIAGNYYPMTTMAYLQDNTTRVSLLSRQSHGVSSLNKGWIEVMLDRKLSYDDSRGLGEGINDNLPTDTKFLLLVEHSKGSRDDEMFKVSYPSLLSHELSSSLLYPFSNFYQFLYETPFMPIFNPLKTNLPCDLKIVNLKTMFSPHDKNSLEVAMVLHRTGFQCQYASNMLNCSADVGNVAFNQIFTDLTVSQVSSRSLSLMYSKHDPELELRGPGTTIAVEPMDFATYLLTFK